MGEQKRVVVTGMGVIAPVGNTVEDSWANVVGRAVGLGADHALRRLGSGDAHRGRGQGLQPEE